MGNVISCFKTNKPSATKPPTREGADRCSNLHVTDENPAHQPSSDSDTAAAIKIEEADDAACSTDLSVDPTASLESDAGTAHNGIESV
uniref:Uncharacterized protein n=1 Tax=Peronospora matthiolae TaxID=2874970 RepID=A0AAV1V7V7_9STRA